MTKECYEKLCKEYDELLDKTQKLNTFIDESEEFYQLSKYEQFMLMQQFDAMQSYANCLEERINFYTDQIEKDEKEEERMKKQKEEIRQTAETISKYLSDIFGYKI